MRIPWFRYCGLFWSLEHGKNINKFEWVQQRTIMMVLPCEERLRDQGWLSLEKRWLQRDWQMPLTSYTRVIEEMEPGCSQWCRVIGEELTGICWSGDFRRNVFSTTMVKQWLPREATQTLFLEVFKIHLIWSHSQFYSEQKVGLEIFWGPF